MQNTVFSAIRPVLELHLHLVIQMVAISMEVMDSIASIVVLQAQAQLLLLVIPINAMKDDQCFGLSL
jgi:hypothetical protein